LFAPRKKQLQFFFKKSHNEGVLCENLKKILKFCTYFFTYSSSTPSKELPLQLLRCSDRPFSRNQILKYAIKTFTFTPTRYYRPNLTFFLCFNVKAIKKSLMRPEKTTFFSNITQWGGIL